MRHKYDTRAIVLARSSTGEANAQLSFITPELGLLRGRAQGVRKSGSKLGSALTTFAESSLVVVRGKEGWRITGAVLEENWFAKIEGSEARTCAARIGGLLLRLSAGETADSGLYPIIHGLFSALPTLDKSLHESAEILAALRLLSALGLDAGALPGETSDFTNEILRNIQEDRTAYIRRINSGIAASGL